MAESQYRLYSTPGNLKMDLLNIIKRFSLIKWGIGLTIFCCALTWFRYVLSKQTASNDDLLAQLFHDFIVPLLDAVYTFCWPLALALLIGGLLSNLLLFSNNKF